MTKIDAKYLTKVYKSGEYALKNCSLTVNSGEFLVVVGASGAGKSTLLKVLAGTEPLSSGELYFDGILADNIPVSKRSVSMAFQEYVLYPHMTVFDNLATPLKLRGEDEKSIYDRVMDTLRLFNLEIAADVKPKQLSGGEQQRVALAKTLLKRSKLVLLDEPLSNIDEKSRWDYCRAIKKMKQMLPESTFIYVTHNTKEALFLADRIAVMQDGVIIEIAKKEFLLNHFEYLSTMEMLGITDGTKKYEFNDPSWALDDELFDIDRRIVDHSRISEAKKITVLKNTNDESCQLFDETGRSLYLSSAELRLCGSLMERTLSFADHTLELNDEYMSRLISCPEKVSVVLQVEKFSKIMLSDGFSLVFDVLENYGDHVVLKIQDRGFILSKRTTLKAGEKIRLYYKTEDIILFEENERLTCHYPLHRAIDIDVYDSQSGKIELLGKRIKLNRIIPSEAKVVRISENSFQVSYDKGKCAVRIYDCLDEEFINGKKLNHVLIKGVDGYLSFMSKDDVTCFGKRKVWLNIIPSKLEF